MKRQAISALAASAAALLVVLVVPLRAAQADTYHQLKECLRHDINMTNRLTWARFVSVADCYAAWGDQKLSINIKIGSASSGYNTRFALAPYLMVDGLSSVTVDVDVLSGDPLQN